MVYVFPNLATFVFEQLHVSYFLHSTPFDMSSVGSGSLSLD